MQMNDELLNIIDDDLMLEEDGDSGADIHVIPGSGLSVVDLKEPERETDWETDGDHDKFLVYLADKMKSIPRHRGHTTVGVERAISYLKKLDGEISKAIRSDEKNIIDEEEAEGIRDQIYDYVDRLEEALQNLSDKKHRRRSSNVKISSSVYSRIGPNGDPMYYIRAENDGEESLLQVALEEPSDLQVRAYIEWEEGKFKKEASSARIVLMADPFLHEVTNIIIRSHVTYGRNIESVYRDLAKKYTFTNRDHLAVHSLLREKGLLIDRDLSRLGEEVEIGTQSVGAKSYPA
jgi:hypothetical protein